MKNISMNIMPMVALAPPPSPYGFNADETHVEKYNVTFSAQFDDKNEAMEFAKRMLTNIQNKD